MDGLCLDSRSRGRSIVVSDAQHRLHLVHGDSLWWASCLANERDCRKVGQDEDPTTARKLTRKARSFRRNVGMQDENDDHIDWDRGRGSGAGAGTAD